DLCEGLLEDLERGRGLVLAEDERGRHPDRIVTTAENEEPFAERRQLDGARNLVVRERESDPHRATPDLGEDRMPRSELAQALEQDPSDPRRVLDQPLVTDHVERGDRRRTWD